MNVLRHIGFNALGFVIMLVTGTVNAQQVGQQGCIKDSLGQFICSQPIGRIMVDGMGYIVCGMGQCVNNSIGQIVCSSQQGGYAMVNSLGQVVCTGGCELASSSMCQRPQ
jgi:hypothetical protein